MQSLQHNLLQLGQMTASSILPKQMKHLNSSSMFWFAAVFCSSLYYLCWCRETFDSTTLLVFALWIVPMSAILAWEALGAIPTLPDTIAPIESLIETTSSLSSMSSYCGYDWFPKPWFDVIRFSWAIAFPPPIPRARRFRLISLSCLWLADTLSSWLVFEASSSSLEWDCRPGSAWSLNLRWGEELLLEAPSPPPMRWLAISSMSASWSLSSLAPSGESLAARRSLILWYSLYLSWSIATWWWWPWSASPSCSSGSLESPRLELLVCISFICSSFRVDCELLSSLFRLLPFPLAPAFVALIESRICCWAWTDSELSCMEGAATTPAAVWFVLAYLKMVCKMVWLSSSCVPPGCDAWLLVLEINASIWEYRSTGGHWLEFGLLSPGWEFILALWVEACVGTLLVKFVELIFWSGLVIFKLRIRWLDPSIYPSESTCWVL